MKLRNITPKKFTCVAAACPAIYADDVEGKIIVVGKNVDIEEVDLAEKVGSDESAVSIDKEMLKEATEGF